MWLDVMKWLIETLPSQSQRNRSHFIGLSFVFILFQLQAAEVQLVPGGVRGLRQADHRTQPGSDQHAVDRSLAGLFVADAQWGSIRCWHRDLSIHIER